MLTILVPPLETDHYIYDYYPFSGAQVVFRSVISLTFFHHTPRAPLFRFWNAYFRKAS